MFREHSKKNIKANFTAPSIKTQEPLIAESAGIYPIVERGIACEEVEFVEGSLLESGSRKGLNSRMEVGVKKSGEKVIDTMIARGERERFLEQQRVLMEQR